MPSLRIAAAQSISIAGDIAANVLTHMRFIAAAHRAGVDLLVFPELSLCGYELPLLRDCLLHAEDIRLAPIRNMARETGMTVVVGAPVHHGTGSVPAIGAIIFFPDGRHAVYCKQHLHPGEDQFAAAGDAAGLKYDLNGVSFSLAICADTAHEQHARNAATAGAPLYLAGVLVSEGGYAADTARMQHYAASLGLGVLMANHGGPSGGYVSAGKSAFWAPGGNLVAAAPGGGNVIVVVDNGVGRWKGELLEVSV
jgi:predicted amidohydrolase